MKGCMRCGHRKSDHCFAPAKTERDPTIDLLCAALITVSGKGKRACLCPKYMAPR